MSKLFYCPECKTLILDFKFKSCKEERELRTWNNCRDGYGQGILHIICSTCGNPLSGIMNIRVGDSEEIEYLKDVINSYNNDCDNGGYLKRGSVETLKKRLLQDKEDDIKRQINFEENTRDMTMEELIEYVESLRKERESKYAYKTIYKNRRGY